MSKKSIYEFWLSQGKEKIRLPVLPEALDIDSPSKNESIDLAGFGEITILQEPGAKTFQFSSFFPAHHGSFVEMRPTLVSKPWNYVETIERWRQNKLPCRFIVTRTPINMAVSIEDFSYDEKGGSVRDLNYSLSLKEYTFVTARKIDTKKKATANNGSTKRPDSKETPKTHTVKKGDTLTGLAKTYYKDSSAWKKIWEANKEMLIKRDKRNVKDQGKWLYPGQKLTIPQAQTASSNVQTGKVSVSFHD